MSVEVVQVEDAQQRLAGQVGLWQEALLARARVVIENIQAEILRVDLKSADGINVFHHQIPGGHVGALSSAFQHFHEEHFGGQVGSIGAHGTAIDRHFPHAVDIAVIFVFKSDPQHLVWLHIDIDGDKAQLGVEGIFRFAQAAGADLLKVAGLLQTKFCLQGLYGLVDIAGVFTFSQDAAVEVIGSIVGQGLIIDQVAPVPGRVGAYLIRADQALRFTQVGQSYDIAHIDYFVAVVGNPDLELFDFKQRVDLRQVGQRALEVVAVEEG